MNSTLAPAAPPIPFQTLRPALTSSAHTTRRRAKATQTAQGDMFKGDPRFKGDTGDGDARAKTAAAQMGSRESSPAETSAPDAASIAPSNKAGRVSQ